MRVEAGQAQPVHRAIPADQRRGLHVSDECVVFDAPGHVQLQSNGHVTPPRRGLSLSAVKGSC
ncbi:glycosyl hydrolase [Streptomyces hygroscopicus subsp. jinggangensis TL01]|nr:glycosyl hydrolase [Streptomyces hygroscopicus subsp. jinggangensis TL01]